MPKKKLKNALIDEVALSLLPPKPRKADRTKVLIVEAAIKNYATFGFDQTTFDKVAHTAGISRPLVMHYFKDKEELLFLAIRHIRLLFQRMAIESIRSSDSPPKQLEAYVRSTFEWIRKFPTHAQSWLYFYYATSIRSKFKDLNSELVEMGRLRIAAILEEGNKQKKWSVKNAGVTAKRIQTVITGALVAAVTEDLPVSLRDFEADILDFCNQTVTLK